MKAILGYKRGMARVFDADGRAVPVTVIEAGPCTVTQVRTERRDGYSAVQLGFGSRKAKRISKPLQGHFKKAKLPDGFRHLGEVRYTPDAKDIPEVGAKVTCDVFAVGDYVDVLGTMKGRGHAGLIRRHGFATQPESHGNHYFWRHSGSIGCRKPQHTVRGMRMAGRMGGSLRTVQNLRVVKVDVAQNLIYVEGAIPGPDQGLVYVRQAKKRAPKPAAKKS